MARCVGIPGPGLGRERWECQGSSSLCPQVRWGSLPTSSPAWKPGRMQRPAGSARWELLALHMSPATPLCPPRPHPPPSLPKPVPQDPAPYPTLLPACAPARENRKGCAAAALRGGVGSGCRCGAYLGPQPGTPGLTPRTGPVDRRTGPAHLARSPGHLPPSDSGHRQATEATRLVTGLHGARLCGSQM